MIEDFLSDMPVDKVFWLHNGVSVRNIYELVKEISNADDGLFSFHCNDTRDDFANWIGGTIGDIRLSIELRGIIDKKLYLNTINTRIKHLEDEKIRRQKRDLHAENFWNMMRSYGHIFLLIFIFISTSIITAMLYFEYHNLMNLKALDERMTYIEDRNTCYNSYFNDQIYKTNLLVNNSLQELDKQCIYNYNVPADALAPIYENNPESVPRKDIIVGQDRLIVDLNNSALVLFANSSSMVPTLWHNTKGIETKVRNESQLHIGDVVSYQSADDIIVHRIIEIKNDSEGWYVVTKGDNNDVPDYGKVRFDMIRGKILVLIY